MRVFILDEINTRSGPSDRDRTCGLMVPNHPRSQLRHTRISIRFFLNFAWKWDKLWSNANSTPFCVFVKCRKSAPLKAFRAFRKISAITTRHAPKAGALPTALHPDIHLCLCLLVTSIVIIIQMPSKSQGVCVFLFGKDEEFAV